MKPKYPISLGKLVNYYFYEYGEYDYKLRVFLDGKSIFDSGLECCEFLGYSYANVLEFYRDSKNKVIRIYTEDSL